jgi:WD40 repeat protein
LGLLVGFRDTIFEGFFRAGYWAPTYMLLVSGVLLLILRLCRVAAKPGWDRHLLDLSTIVITVSTVVALMTGWEDLRHNGKLSRAVNWHTFGLVSATAILLLPNLARLVATQIGWRPAPPPAPTPPAPVPAGRTGFVLGVGYAVLGVGFAGSLLARDLPLPDETKTRTLAFLMGIWVAGSLLAFGPGVFVARAWWRKRRPEDRRADIRAALLAALGITATVGSVALTVALTPTLRADLFGPPPPGDPTLVINWDVGFVDRVVLESDDSVVAEETGPESRLVRTVAPGTYTVRGYFGRREVYVESFTLEAGEQKVLSMFTGTSGADGAYLRVVCGDRGAAITATGDGHTFAFNHPGFQTVVGQRLRAEEPYRLTVAHGSEVVHAETVFLKNGEQRELRIPPIVLPARTVELKPKAGSFPSDVVRMQLAPDRSAVAVERFDGPILVFDAITGEERFTVGRPKSHCTAFGFTPDGKRLTFLIQTESPEHVLPTVNVRTVDARDGKPSGKDLKPPLGRNFLNSRALAYSPDGNLLTVSSTHNARPDDRWESRILRWEVPADGAEFRELDPLEQQDGTIAYLRFTADGGYLAAQSDNGVGRLWPLSGNKTGGGWGGGPDTRTTAFAIGSRGHIATASTFRQTSSIHWFMPKPLGARRGSPPFPPPLIYSPVAFSSVAFSPDEGLFAAGTAGTADLPWEQRAAVRIWKPSTGQERAVLLGHTDWLLDLAFLPDGKEIVSASKDGTVRFWNLSGFVP